MRVALLASVGLAAVGVSCWGFTVDDAYIVARYAQHLVDGQGYVMNSGDTPSDGVTGPLWLIPAVLAQAISLDPVVSAKAVGLSCMVLAVFCTVAAARTRSGGRLGAAVTAWLLALQPTLGSWAVGGLETGAATLAVVALWRTSCGRPRPLAAGCAAGALAWLRPELAPCAAVLLFWLWGRDRRSGLRALAVAAGCASALVALRLLAFGHPWPLSLAAKPADLASGASYVLRALLVTTGGLGAALPWLSVTGAGRASDRVLLAALGAHGLSLCLAGGDWMPGFRLLAPVLPIYAYLSGVGFARRFRSGRRYLVSVALLCAICLPMVDLSQRIPQAWETRASRRGVGAELSRVLRGVHGAVAMVDVGYLAYRSGARVVDLGGVTDPEIAFSPGGHLDKHVSGALLRRRGTEAIVLHARRPPRMREGRLVAFDGYPVERRVAATDFVKRHFRVTAVFPYAPGYHYLLLQRQ